MAAHRGHSWSPGGSRRGAGAPIVLLLSWLAATPALGSPPADPSAGAPAEAAILSVEPFRRDSLLVCALATRGLPDRASRETISSGLPSSLALLLTLTDAVGEELAQARVEVRIEPDLLAEGFVVRSPLLDLRAGTLDEITAILAGLGPLPVAPLARLDPAGRMHIEARLAIHPLAPSEIERAHALFAGDDPGREERREVSIGIGTLLGSLFGRSANEDWAAAQTSASFRADSLEVWP